jgi:hypothetical protein
MLGAGFLTDGRRILRPLACLLAGALLTSTSPLRAAPPNAEEGKAAIAADDANRARPVVSFDRLAAIGVTTQAVKAAAAQPSPSPAPTPPAPKDNANSLRTIGYIAGGVGIVGFIVFAVAGIGAKNAHDRLEETLQACNAGLDGTRRAIDCNDAFQPAADGKRLQTIANIGLATGLAGVGLGATLIMLSHPANDTSAVATAPQGGMITFAGRF